MSRRETVLLLLVALLPVAPLRAAPQEALIIALNDAKTLDKETAYHSRYLDLSHLAPAERAFYARVLALHVNLLSREASLVPPRPVGGGAVLALDLRDYAIDAKVWERLLDREPYYHERLDYTEQVPQYGRNGYGQQVVTGYQAKVTRKAGPARYLNRAATDDLYRLTNSQVPVVTGDWFFVQTSVEADRGGIGKGFGYYDFLGLKNRADYFRLIGFDEKDWRGAISEIAAIVLGHNSGVAANDRVIVRRGAVDGWAWFTLDFFDSNRDDHNPLAFLDRDKGLRHQAERHFGRLPNGLPVVIACDDKGVLQETAPDKIGPDTSANGNDKRIHSSKSCLSCHSNGFLKDVSDEVREIYKFDRDKGFNLLTSPVKEEAIKLQRIYLRDLNHYLENDRREYARAVKECNGQDVKEASADYRDAYERYVLRPLNADQVAAGLGVTRQEFEVRMAQYRAADKLTSHVVAPLSVGRPVTRGNFEQFFPLLMQLTRGVPR